MVIVTKWALGLTTFILQTAQIIGFHLQFDFVPALNVAHLKSYQPFSPELELQGGLGNFAFGLIKL